MQNYAPGRIHRRWQSVGDESQEMETVRDDANVLAFQIPEAPYSDELFIALHRGFDIVHGITMTFDIFGGEVVALAGVALGSTVVGALAAFVGSLFAIGAPYVEAAHEVSRKRVKMGFAEGLVAGADGASWKFTQSLFWATKPEFNAFDAKIGFEAAKANNVGLAAGFVQGRKLTDKQRRLFFWPSLAKELSEGDRTFFGGDHTRWTRDTWQSYYILMAAKFIKLYVKED